MIDDDDFLEESDDEDDDINVDIDVDEDCRWILFILMQAPVISLMIPWLLPLSSAYINTSVMT